MSRRIAVIDIGSNSIKVLVAARGNDGSVAALRIRTIDARISAGISRATPRLSEEGIERGVDAIRTLIADAADFSPDHWVLVATSAVRDAENGAEFKARVRAATGHDIRILSGGEEANLIGRGLTCDPSLRAMQDFYVFDLGGGSLEALAFRRRRIEAAVSLPLGSVRLTEKFLRDSTLPLGDDERSRIAAEVRARFTTAGFAFSLPSTAIAVGTGGSVATVRSILGARLGQHFEATSPVVTVAELQQLLHWIGALPLDARKQVSGLPAARADIFPTALVTLVTLADLGGFSAYHNSVYNLRYGLADETLGEEIESM